MKKLFLLLVVTLTMVPVCAQIRGYDIQVNVVPDHQDWTYKTGETATFKISVTRSATLLNDAERQDDEAWFLSC